MNIFQELWFFTRSFLRNKDVGSVVPTARPIVREVCEKMDFSSARVVVEFGPGTGAFTKEILQRMSPDSRLIAFETHADFAKLLESWNDPRLTVIVRTALDIDTELKVLGITHVDYVLSGIPLSFFTEEQRRKLVTEIRDLLRPGGAFFVYQFRPLIEKNLRETFDSVKQSFHPINIPPIYVWEARATPPTEEDS